MFMKEFYTKGKNIFQKVFMEPITIKNKILHQLDFFND